MTPGDSPGVLKDFLFFGQLGKIDISPRFWGYKNVDFEKKSVISSYLIQKRIAQGERERPKMVGWFFLVISGGVEGVEKGVQSEFEYDRQIVP